MLSDNGIAVGYEIPLKDAGRDVLLEVLSDPSRQGRFNRKQILDKPAKEQPIKYSDYSELPAFHYTHR